MTDGIGNILKALLLINIPLCLIAIAGSTTVGENDFDINYADLAAILLGASAVILTAIGLGVAYLAFIGYRNIEGIAKQQAETFIANEMKPGGDLYRQFVRTAQSAQLSTASRDTDLSDLDLENRL